MLLGTYPKLGLFHRPKQKDKDLAMKAIRKLEMEDYVDNQIDELSGG